LTTFAASHETIYVRYNRFQGRHFRTGRNAAKEVFALTECARQVDLKFYRNSVRRLCWSFIIYSR